MTNNAWPGVLLLVLAAPMATGCEPRAEAWPGFQGIVEHDQRVIAAEAGGLVEEVLVDRGAPVRRGELLVRLDDSLVRLGVDVRAAEVDVAQADLALLEAGSRREEVASLAAQVRAAAAVEVAAERTWRRTHELFGAGAVPQAELDRAEAELARARGDRDAREAQRASLARGARPEELVRARARKTAAERAAALELERASRADVFAGVDGVVVDVLAEPGELAVVGTPLLLLADLDHPYADVFVPAQTVTTVKLGAPATVHVDGAAALRGAVEWIAERTEFTPRFVFSPKERPRLVTRVRVRIEDPDHVLRGGLPAFVELGR